VVSSSSRTPKQSSTTSFVSRDSRVRDKISRLYALKASLLPHPSPNGPRYGEPPPDFVHVVPPEERKPNPRLLLDICAREGVSPAETWYVGDSLTRDVSMALAAGCVGVWARYGTGYSKEYWQQLCAGNPLDTRGRRTGESPQEAVRGRTPFRDDRQLQGTALANVAPRAGSASG
jgi:hypothetical protein